MIHYSKPFELLHGAAFQRRTRLETPGGSFLKKPRRFVYNVMHLWHIKSLRFRAKGLAQR
jgi:hypothetical protein